MDRSCARAGGQQPHNPAAIGVHRTGAEETSATRRARLSLAGLDARAWRNLGAVGLAWFLLIAIALTGWFVVVVPLRAEILDNDLTLVYVGARIGLGHGWSHIYSLSLQHDLFTRLRPHAVFNDGERFVSPPPFAWLIVPLIPLGPAGTVIVWLALSLAALVAAWWMAAPGAMPMRWLWLLGALAWYPILYGLSLAQADLVVVLALAAAWWLARQNRPYLAGMVLAISVIKPQLTLMVPPVLLLAGRWRIAAAWAVTAGVLALVSLAAIGTQGLQDYLSLLNEARNVSNNRYFTLAYAFGPGELTLFAQVVIAGSALISVSRNRHATDDRVFAIGILATALSAPYWHLQDFTLLVLAAWLSWREGPNRWQKLLLLAVAVTAELAWPLTPLPLLLAILIWYATLISERRPVWGRYPSP